MSLPPSPSRLEIESTQQPLAPVVEQEPPSSESSSSDSDSSESDSESDDEKKSNLPQPGKEEGVSNIDQRVSNIDQTMNDQSTKGESEDEPIDATAWTAFTAGTGTQEASQSVAPPGGPGPNLWADFQTKDQEIKEKARQRLEMEVRQREEQERLAEERRKKAEAEEKKRRNDEEKELAEKQKKLEEEREAERRIREERIAATAKSRLGDLEVTQEMMEMEKELS